MRKKITIMFSFIFVICNMLFMCSNISVLAATQESDNTDITLTVYWKTGETEVINVTPEENIEKPLIRNSVPPRVPYDLTSSSYTYKIEDMKNYVYTDYFFHPDSKGRISISTDGLNAGNKSIKITLLKYNGTFDEIISSWTGDPQSIQGLGFNNLNTSGEYSFLFRTVEATSVSGSGIIHHP